MVGVCFRELFIGKANTLNFEVNIFPKRPNSKHNSEHRYRAMWAFHKLMMAAEIERRAVQKSENPDVEIWKGYYNRGLEKLRQGIGPEDIEKLDVLRALRRKTILKEPWSEDIANEINNRLEEEEAKTRKIIAAKARKAVTASNNEMSQDGVQEVEHQGTRPVVTFMIRMGLR